MTFAMLLIGILLGIALSALMALFGILSLEGSFGTNLRDAGSEARRRITGQRVSGLTGRDGSRDGAGAELRARALQEEIRVMQRLLDQARCEREAQGERMKSAAEEVASLRTALEKLASDCEAMEAELRAARAERDSLRDEVTMRMAELEKTRRELRDLETELSLGGVDASAEVEQLRRERDALAARLALFEGDAGAREELDLTH
jgi:chromosome segregation ATPase